MEKDLEVTVNGKPYPYTKGMTLSLLLDALLETPDSVVAEVNGKIISRDAFATTALVAGDRIEIVHFVGGG